MNENSNILKTFISKAHMFKKKYKLYKMINYHDVFPNNMINSNIKKFGINYVGLRC